MATARHPSSPRRPSPATLGAGLVPLRERLGRESARLRRRLAGAPGGPARRDFLPRSQASPIEERLRPVAARLRSRRALETLPVAGLAFAAVLFWGAVLARAFGAPGILWLSFFLAIGGALWLIVRAARRRVGPWEAARSADDALDLRERLATALELLDTGARGVLTQLQLADAGAAALRVVPKQAVPVFAPGSPARRVALQRSGLASALLALALLIVMWPYGDGPLVSNPVTDKLALAQPGRPEESLLQAPRPADGPPDVGESVEGRTNRPDVIGDSGLVGQPNNPAGQPGQQGSPGQQGNPGQNGQQDAGSQQNANLEQRQQALQELGSALRQSSSQAARQAGEALRGEDTQRAGQQLRAAADQVPRMSAGERQNLSQAFQQAAQSIGDKDQQLAQSSRQAAEALRDFKTGDAQSAIRSAAAQVEQTGQQARQQSELEQRQQAMASGQNPQLPTAQQQGQQPGQQGNQSPQGQQGSQSQGQGQGQQPPRQVGDPAAGSPGGQGDQAGLDALEAALRNGGQQGGAAGQGAGRGSGGEAQGQPHRLNVDGRTVEVEAEVRPGPSQWRPPSPNAPPAAPAPVVQPVPGGPVSAAPIGAGADVNSYPSELRQPVLDYFTPPPAPPAGQAGQSGQPAPAAAPATGGAASGAGTGRP